MNDYRLSDEEGTEIHRPDPSAEAKQSRRLEASRSKRDPAAAERALSALKQAAASDRNLMDPILDAARARTSEGEMIAALQEVFGTYTEQPQF